MSKKKAKTKVKEKGGLRDASIERVVLAKITPAGYNPRVDLKPDHETYKSLKRSIEEFGFVEPIVWNRRTGNLVGGHQRLKVLLEMGAKEAQAVVVDLDAGKEKALNIALNKIEGQWDFGKLTTVLLEFRDDELQPLTGFSSEKIEELLKMNDRGTEQDRNTIDEKLKVYESNEILQIVLYFDAENYFKTRGRLDAIMKKSGAKNHSEAFLVALNSYKSGKVKA